MKPLFSREYISMALAGDFRMERRDVEINFFHILLEKFTILFYWLLLPLAKIPIVCHLWEMFVRCYGQNTIGFFLRSCYWKTQLNNMGTNVFFDYNVHIWCPERVEIGDDVHLDAGVVIFASDGFVRIGSRINIGCYSIIHGRGGVIIEDDCGISPQVAIYSSTHYQWFPDGRRMAIGSMSKEEQYILSKPVAIRHNSFIKFGSLITHGQNGIEIGPYGFVLPNSMIKTSVPAEEMWGGSPAIFVREWKERK